MVLNLQFKNFFKSKSHCAVQTPPARFADSPFNKLDQPFLPSPEYGLYAAIRRSVPIIDAALDKIVRLTGGFQVLATNASVQPELQSFVENVRVGAGSFGLHQFISIYLDSMITYGNAVGEIVLDGTGGIYALYNAGIGDIRIKCGRDPLDVKICASKNGFDFEPVKYPDLVLFTPLNPSPGEITGTPLLRSMPFVTSVLMEIYNSIYTNFKRVANLRYAVTYKPAGSLDKENAKEIAESIAGEWSGAINAASRGEIRDFVAVGDVGIKVIGADNQMIDTEVPVRQMLEQIVAKLGIPPFMLGLHWSTTERMSTQQADILTSELESYRKVLSSVILRICNMFLRLEGHACSAKVIWEDINLQDELEAAKARLISAQALKIEDDGVKQEVNN